ncbi:hypothetical protein HELRODRAFT_138301, partial [Helobdella robusta]|uniref:BHLH domain-containing protein n=1 Tax=Helobdella robusta TaxID=6412 RepID=T1EIS9_HELRO
KRAQHNVLERKRRSTLKELFFSLRDAVPSMKGNGKFSKVSILENATTHINCQEMDLQRLDEEFARLKRENAELQ